MVRWTSGLCWVLLRTLLVSNMTFGQNSISWQYDLQESRQQNHTLVECSNSAKITFIMPSSGSRSSIKRAIHSLLLLNSCEWQLIVVYSTLQAVDDQLEIYPPIQVSRFSEGFENDPRIFYLPAQRPSLFNYGGISRNAAMRHATTEWVAFLDDDDEVSPDYLTLLERETQAHPSISVILFRMSCHTCYAEIIPPVPYSALLPGYVGPSSPAAHLTDRLFQGSAMCCGAPSSLPWATISSRMDRKRTTGSSMTCTPARWTY
jgi:hypothetical protein